MAWARIGLVMILSVCATLGTRAQQSAPVIDHQGISLFEQIPAEYKQAASNLRLLFVNRSVGGNVSMGLDCLAVPYDGSPSYCRRWNHEAPEFSVPAMTWSGVYPRTRWAFAGWPNTGILPELQCGLPTAAYWYNQLDCFIRHIDANPGAYDVAAFQFSYLEVTDQSDIIDPVRGFFGSAPPAGRLTVADLVALRSRHPQIRFVLMTSSLARSIGTAQARDFNAALREYARANNWPLYDFAGFTSYAPNGEPCFDYRDGVPYVTGGQVRENHPDDGLNMPAICQHYTGDIDGGHLRSAGMIRAAQAWWILMARLAGWQSGETSFPAAPRNLRIIG